MEGEQHHYDLRSRSRSRSHTPMIFNQLTEAEYEHHYALRSKESRERSHTPIEVSSSRRSGSRSLPSSVMKQKDQNMETISENREEIQPEGENENGREKSISTVKKPERRSERQRVKRKIFANGQEESKEGTSGEKTEQKRRSMTPKKTVTSDYSSEEGEREDPPSRPGSAYEIYKQAGDWWNVFPKTDYTYSQTSQCRYEIAPGVMAMPNMSRPSIHSDCSSASSTLSSSQRNSSQLIECREGHVDSLDGELSDTIEQNRLNEENARLLSYDMKNSSARLVYKQTQIERFSHHATVFYGDSNNLQHRFSQVDSDTELDEAIPHRLHSQSNKWWITRWFQTTTSIIILLFVNIFEFINSKILRRKSVSTSHYQYRESRWSNTWTQLDYALQYVYLFLIKVLFLDSWLLSRGANFRKNFLARRSKLIWLLLLPLLSLAGCWFITNAQTIISTLPNVLPMYVINEKKTTSIYPNDKLREELSANSNGAAYDEIRRSIAVLMERIDKLEASNNNEKELIENITEMVDKAETYKKDNWELYNKKLSHLEEKINNRNVDTTNDELTTIKLEFNNLQKLYAQLKIDCDKNTISLSNYNYALEEDVRKIVARYFTTEVSREEIEKIVRDVIIESNNIVRNTTNSLNEVTNIKEECQSDCKKSENLVSLSEEQMKKLVKEILKIYDADKTGRVDYALESAGGQIISIRCTQRYNVNTRAFKVLGFTLFYESGDPRTVIQGHQLQPGVCWAFQDFPGYLLIKLRSSILVTGFTLEHVPKSILPNNEIKSAPKKFNVWGLKRENDANPVLFGEYEYLDNDESLQYFPVQNKEITEPYEYVELRIHSNHGQLEYTCLYRFRVHGMPQ
ncbi:uncharacterized protein [Chelonus insularis]|uniref:uncharacterized protein n=1 Tax=Chelonus insularis TaxID=460826 RepID=UPI00158C1458|nr:uncharacterized protein LOC118074413 [Chelonus insularis]XP_034951495.1 uncharacterized protein LOC118074413 [Chelonus insularis]XP_034951496.1 uncharacterized protein LOC118074413 [Chelonus insularis]